MAYLSHTLRVETSAIDGSIRRWLMDNNDAPATIDTGLYISDGVKKGMSIGDIVTYRQWAIAPAAPSIGRSNPGVNTADFGALIAVSQHVVVAVTGNAVGLSDPTAIVVTNTD
jgi:hypothetical protein